MNKISMFAAVAAIALSAAAQAVPDVNLDGSAPHKKPTLAATANHQLRQDAVPSARTPPADVKAQADADMAARDARSKGPRLVVHRQNLKGDDARRAIARQANPNTIDRATANGDIDHTEQVTNLKVTVKK